MAEDFCPYAEEAHRFIDDNPHIWQAFCCLALEALLSGKTRCSQRLLWERLRWDYYIASNRPISEFNLNNNYVKPFARKLLRDFPLTFPSDFFSFRSRPAQAPVGDPADSPPAC